MKHEITRKDGIVYERKAKNTNYDTIINIRISKELKEKIQSLTKEQGINTAELIRNSLEDYINKNGK